MRKYIIMFLLIPEGLNVSVIHKAHTVHVDHSSQEKEQVLDTEIFFNSLIENIKKKSSLYFPT